LIVRRYQIERPTSVIDVMSRVEFSREVQLRYWSWETTGVSRDDKCAISHHWSSSPRTTPKEEFIFTPVNFCESNL